MKIEKGSFELMKQLNQQIIFQYIRDHGPISRAEIAKRINLTPPTVSKVVNELMEAGFVQETEVGESNGGRRPILVAINPAGGYVVGVNISVEEITALVADLEFKYLARGSGKIISRDPLKVCDQAEELVREVVGKAEIPMLKVLGVGVALHGLVDHQAGISIFAPHLKWSEFPIGQIMAERLQLPVSVDNDVRLMAAGEMWKGGARGEKNFAYINVDYGVGMGIVLEGHLLRGMHNSAGEIGHIQVKVDGPPCNCGRIGCLEAVISLNALQGLDSNTIRQTVAAYLGQSIATTTTLLDLQKVILGGRVLKLAPEILPAIKEEFSRQVLPLVSAKTTIVPGELDADASITGAITMVLSEFYEGGSLQ